jgi:hypothetical protein
VCHAIESAQPQVRELGARVVIATPFAQRPLDERDERGLSDETGRCALQRITDRRGLIGCLCGRP